VTRLESTVSIPERKLVVSGGRLGVEAAWLFELQLWTVSRGATSLLVDLEPHELCRVAGLIERIRLDPRTGVFEAWITDGTASVVAQWSIDGPMGPESIGPGRAVVLEGVAAVGPDGGLVLRDPAFETAPFPGVA
jgi:hypothetical protein